MKYHVLLFLLVGCASKPFVEDKPVCLNKRPTQKYVATFTVDQKVPKGLSTDQLAVTQRFVGEFSHKVAMDYFQRINESGELNVPMLFPSEHIQNLKLEIVHLEEMNYLICRSENCKGIKGAEGPSLDAIKLSQFFKDNYFEGLNLDEAFAKAIQVRKKIEADKNAVILQVTLKMEEFCKYARPKTDFITN